MQEQIELFRTLHNQTHHDSDISIYEMDLTVQSLMNDMEKNCLTLREFKKLCEDTFLIELQLDADKKEASSRIAGLEATLKAMAERVTLAEASQAQVKKVSLKQETKANMDEEKYVRTFQEKEELVAKTRRLTTNS